jgi:hypothetical protein
MACSLHWWECSLLIPFVALNIFTVNGIQKGQGDGASKQLAKEEAARQAYYAMGWAPVRIYRIHVQPHMLMLDFPDAS